jgi:uncharacterized protein with von Willebrand factor type A (vWA) domain
VEKVSKTDKKLGGALALAKQCYSGVLDECFALLYQMNSDYHKKMRQMQKDLDHAGKRHTRLLSYKSLPDYLLKF